MKQTIDQQLITAKTHIQAGDYNLAIIILDGIDVNNISDTKGDYYLLLSEASLALGKLKHNYAEQAVFFFRTTSEHNKYALILIRMANSTIG